MPACTAGAGLHCPDWPFCHGGLPPPAEQEAIIEYSHRTLAAVTGLLVALTLMFWAAARRTRRGATALFEYSISYQSLLFGAMALHRIVLG